MRRFTFGGLALGVLLAVSAAHGAPVDEAREHFKKGVELFKSGEPAAALSEFEAADAMHHAPPITYNIARAREALGQVQAALEAYRAYLDEAGAKAEYSAAAALSIDQIKQKSTRLSVTSEPAGATVRVDGVALRDKTPVVLFVARGRHEIQLEHGDWRELKSIEAEGAGSSLELSFVQSRTAEAPEPKPVPPVPTAAPDRDRGVARRARDPEPDGLVGGAAFSLSGYSFVGNAEEKARDETTESDSAAKGLVFGLYADAGWALSSKTIVVLRAFGGLGSAQGELATVGAAGPFASFRLARSVWAGGGLAVGAGKADSDATTAPESGGAKDDSITFNTNVALGPMLELSYAFASFDSGQWLISVLPGILITTTGEQSTLFVPLVVGFRWF